jgi:hypothetical protein
LAPFLGRGDSRTPSIVAIILSDKGGEGKGLREAAEFFQILNTWYNKLRMDRKEPIFPREIMELRREVR